MLFQYSIFHRRIHVYGFKYLFVVFFSLRSTIYNLIGTFTQISFSFDKLQVFFFCFVRLFSYFSIEFVVTFAFRIGRAHFDFSIAFIQPKLRSSLTIASPMEWDLMHYDYLSMHIIWTVNWPFWLNEHRTKRPACNAYSFVLDKLLILKVWKQFET